MHIDSRFALCLNSFNSDGGQHGQESEEGKEGSEEDREEEKEVASFRLTLSPEQISSENIGGLARARLVMVSPNLFGGT